MTFARWAIVTAVVALFNVLTPSLASAACDQATPTIATDKADYLKTATVSISGCGFSAFEPLSIVITGPDGQVRSVGGSGKRGAYELDADVSGRLELSYELPTSGKAAKPGEYGRYVVAVQTRGGVLLAATAFTRLPVTSATCAPDGNGVRTCWGNSTSDPDFFWLPPTVPSAALFTGPFDPSALEGLTVRICELDDTIDACVAGPAVEEFSAFSSPTPSRITVDQSHEFYTVNWLTGSSHVDRDRFYRVTVLKNRSVIGTIDVDFVQNKPELASIDPTLYVGVVRGQQLTLRFRVQQPTARTRVTINEVESNLGTPGDWIELYNTASVPLSLDGYIVKDNDDAHAYVLPAGATIPPLGYFVVEEAALGFGLGGADAVRLFTPDASTVFDSYAWTAHAATTYGRCPNGVGDFQTTTTVTKGSANDCTILLVINEVESNGGVPGSWVELFNPGPGPANLKGFVFTDSDDTHRFPLPAAVVPAGGYYVVEEAAFRFTLDGVDAARLFRPDGTIADGIAWQSHAPTTYGRCPNGGSAIAVTLGATKGTVNNCFVPVTTLRINEVESNGGTPGDWVELINTGGTSIDLSGWRMLDNDDTHAPYVLPAGSVIAAGGYFVLEEAAFGFGLGAADSVRLYDPLGSLYETYSWTAHATTTYGRCPNATGSFITTFASTKGAANACVAPVAVRINEVESNGGSPGDWFELYNPGPAAADLSGWRMLDNDDAHTPYVFPAGSTIPVGGYLVVEEASFGFGLGAPDSVRLFDATGALYESYSWTTHAASTYGRCPNGAGGFVSTTSTKGAANDCASPVRINEIESNGGTPGDWVELINPTTTPVDISGLIFRDNDDTHAYVIPAGTLVPAGGYFVLEEAAFGFGLGNPDSARLFASNGALLDSFAWTSHATTTYGRCPNGTGAFAPTTASTKGAVNVCPGDPTPWPGGTAVQTADATGVLGGNMSGLIYEAAIGTTPGVLWAVKNGPGMMFRLLRSGTEWTPDTSSGWSSGKTLRYPSGTGDPDAEGVTFTDEGPLGGMYVSTERDNTASQSGISRNSVLRFDVSGSGTTITATHEWNLTADLPSVGSNLGMEAITWIPDTFLTGAGFFDESKGHAYSPSEYPNHGKGLFFVGLEATGGIYAYALLDGGTFTRIATINSGLVGVMDLAFDRETQDLWAVCDDGCGGSAVVLAIDPVTHRFVVTRTYARPASMPNLNNEGFAIAPIAECSSGVRPVFWSDDSNTDSHAIRQGTVSCSSVR